MSIVTKNLYSLEWVWPGLAERSKIDHTFLVIEILVVPCYFTVFHRCVLRGKPGLLFLDDDTRNSLSSITTSF